MAAPPQHLASNHDVPCSRSGDPRGQHRQSRGLLCPHAGLHLRLGGRARRHRRHLQGQLQTVSHQSLLPGALRKRRPYSFWLNLESKAEVDELFAEWSATQAKILSEPEDKPWKLREFIAADLDGNLIRVFYDFRNDLSELHVGRVAQD
jgi:hypothetical protein